MIKITLLGKGAYLIEAEGANPIQLLKDFFKLNQVEVDLSNVEDVNGLSSIEVRLGAPKKWIK